MKLPLSAKSATYFVAASAAIVAGASALIAWRVHRSAHSQEQFLFDVTIQKAEHQRLADEIRRQYGQCALRPVMPGHDTASAVFPEVKEVQRYALQCGCLFPPRSDDYVWTKDVIQRHPSPDARVIAKSMLPNLLSDGHPFEMMKSELSDEEKGDVVTELTRMISFPKSGEAIDEREQVARACFAARLWRIEAIRDALQAVRNVNGFQNLWAMSAHYAEMDKFERGKFYSAARK